MNKYKVGDKVIYLDYPKMREVEILAVPDSQVPSEQREKQFGLCGIYDHPKYDQYRILIEGKGWNYVNDYYLCSKDDPKYFHRKIEMLEKEIEELKRPKGLFARIFG